MMMVPRKYKILLVEDEFLISINLRRQLVEMGFSPCTSAATGEEAVRIAAAEHPDFILMDISLAGKMNGLEAARIILAQNVIPIIFMSGYTDAATLEQLRQQKPLGILSKPVSTDELFSLLNSVISPPSPNDEQSDIIN
jgi:CheY-like chemotaxis protein